MNRNETIKTIRTNLQRRSGKTWSVTGGRGTAYGWITIDAPPARRRWQGHRETEHDTEMPGGHMGPADRAGLAALLGLDVVHFQGVSIPAGNDYYQEYLDRSAGVAPTKTGEPYWD